MDDPDSTYAPQSPDFSAYASSPPPPYAPPAQSDGRLAFRDTFAPHPAYHASPYFNPQPQVATPLYHTTNAHHNHNNKPPSRVKPDDDDEFMPDASSSRPSRAGRTRKADVKSEEDAEASGTNSVIVKTKFPVARIKRIMQADEDVGKVAQVTPVIVSKALELFMISLVCKAAQEAGSRNQKRITAAHLKQAIAKDEQFDFLQDIIAKVPDAPATGEKTEEGEGDSKKKKVGRRKRKASDDI
ncbi:MAG: hypothetical protein M1839_005223 [Geoglossum umbratile]|nr:MAG: hypothetical protein M1839_005223 [Geoglossum umbratile]